MNVALAEKTAMARKAGRPKKPGGEGTPIRIEPDLAAKARIVALRRHLPTSDYVSEIIRARVLKDFAKVMAEAGADEAEGGGK